VSLKTLLPPTIVVVLAPRPNPRLKFQPKGKIALGIDELHMVYKKYVGTYFKH